MQKMYLCLAGRMNFIKLMMVVVVLGIGGKGWGQVTNDYRSVTGGTWLGTATATWERFNGTVWNASAAPLNSTTNSVYIRHAVSANGSFGSTINVVIETGGTFTVTAASTTASILINNGGILQINAALTNTGAFTIENGGRANLNNATTSGVSALWNGTENFKSGSTFEILNWSYGAGTPNARLIQSPSIISANSTGGYYFGNLIISGSPSAIFVMSVGSQTINLAENNFTSSSGGSNVTFTNSGSNITIGGNLVVTAGQFSFATTTTANTPIATVNGSILLTGGTIDLNQGNAAAATSIVQLKNDLTTSLGSSLISTDDGCKIVFSGNTSQKISVAGTLATRVDFEIAALSTAQLVNQNLALPFALNDFNVLALGTLDFNGFNITGLGSFSQLSTGSLKITSALGINPTGNNTGNLQNTGTRTFSQSGYFYFTGNSNPQSTGLAITSGSTAKRIFIEKTNSTDVVNLTQSTGTTDQLTITKGTFVETSLASVTGSGALNMGTDGKYIIPVLLTTVPQLSGPYNLNGSSNIELNGAGSQILRGGISSYRNLTFSGSTSTTLSNMLTTGIIGTLYITGSAKLDLGSSNTFGNSSTNLTMDGGRLTMAGSGTDKPDIDGVYNLTGGVVEFAGSAAGAQPIKGQTAGGTTNIIYKNIEVTGTNVGTGAYNIYLNKVAGSFTVKSPNAVYAPNTRSIISENNTNTSIVTIESGGTFKIGNNQGFSGTTYAVTSNSAIDNSIGSSKIFLNPGSTVDYAGASAQIISNQIPYQNFAISATAAVNKTAPGSADGDLIIKGNITKGTGATFLHNNGTVSLEGTAAQTYTATDAGMEFYTLVNKNTTGSGFNVNNDLGVVNQLILSPAGRTSPSIVTFGAGNINLRSGPGQTASIPDLGTTLLPSINYTVAGRFQIERYLPAFKSWRFLSTPIVMEASPTIADAWRESNSTFSSTGYGTQMTSPFGPLVPSNTAIFDENTVRGSIKVFQANNSFQEITNTNTTPIANREGYFVFVRGDRSVNKIGGPGITNLRIKGKILTGNQTYTVAPSGFLSVGNPFPSRIDFQLVTKTNMVDGYYSWNPSPFGYGVGRYELYFNFGDGNYRLGNSTGPIKNFIESGQGILIQSISGGNIVIKEGDKTSGSANVSRTSFEGRPGVNSPTLELNLHTIDTNGSNIFADGTVLQFDQTYANSIDNLDVRKISNSAENLSIQKTTNKLIVERRQTLQAIDTIFLSLTNTRIAPYRFEIDPSVLGNLPLTAYLKDKFLGTETPVSLTDVTNVNFSITSDAASRVADRFMIVFRPGGVGGPLPVNFVSITGEKNTDKTNTVKWSVANEINITGYTIERSTNGNLFAAIGNNAAAANNGNSAAYNFIDATPAKATNYYRIKATSSNGQVQYSSIVKVVEAAVKPLFAVTPNPVENKTVRMNFENMEGVYGVTLLSKQGASVYTTSLNVSSAREVKKLALGSEVAAGVYELRLINKEGKSFTQTVFIQ